MNFRNNGFTLVEFVVVIAVTAIIALGAGTTIVQVTNLYHRNTDTAKAIRYAQNVGYWVSWDAQMANSINTTDDSGTTDVEFINVSHKDWETGDTYDIRYVWIDSFDSLNKVKRIQLIRDKDGVTIDNTTTLIADNIYTANISWQSGIWGLSVEARSGRQSAIREFSISRRYET